MRETEHAAGRGAWLSDCAKERLRDIGIIAWVIFGLPLLGVVVALLDGTLLDRPIPPEMKQFWRDAVLVRTCDDGTDIFRMPNGEFATIDLDTGSSPYTVEDPATACN